MKSLGKKRALALLSILILWGSGALFLLAGKPVSNEASSMAADSPNVFMMISQIALVLGLIVVLIYATIYFLKKFVYHSPRGNGNQLVEIVSVVPVAARKSICVAKVLDRLLVIGMTDAQMTKLMEISDVDEVRKWTVSLAGTSKPQVASFAQQLQGFLKGAK